MSSRTFEAQAQAVKRLIKKSEVFSCPCCDNTKLMVGGLASCTLGVRCSREHGGCGLTIERDTFEYKTGFKALRAAIKAWNCRVIRK